jgi:hypothetical protein
VSEEPRRRGGGLPPLWAVATSEPAAGLQHQSSAEPIDLLECAARLDRAACDLSDVPAALMAEDSKTASIYVEAARRNLSFAAEVIRVDLSRPDLDMEDEEIDSMLLEWLT